MVNSFPKSSDTKMIRTSAAQFSSSGSSQPRNSNNRCVCLLSLFTKAAGEIQRVFPPPGQTSSWRPCWHNGLLGVPCGLHRWCASIRWQLGWRFYQTQGGQCDVGSPPTRQTPRRLRTDCGQHLNLCAQRPLQVAAFAQLHLNQGNFFDGTKGVLSNFVEWHRLFVFVLAVNYSVFR